MNHARKTDPISSHLAANENAKRRPEQVLETAAKVTKYKGKTTAELAYITTSDRYILGRRCPDAERMGLIVRGDLRVCTVSGRMALTWWPKPVK